jgi:hypothetical protein
VVDSYRKQVEIDSVTTILDILDTVRTRNYLIIYLSFCFLLAEKQINGKHRIGAISGECQRCLSFV